jgi:hypothetical protein
VGRSRRPRPERDRLAKLSPDSIGLGGGSIVRHGSDGAPLAVGPASVGYGLGREALVFGGAIWGQKFDRRGKGRVCTARQTRAASADPATIQTIEIEDMPLACLPGNALRVRVRVAGEMGAA